MNETIITKIVPKKWSGFGLTNRTGSASPDATLIHCTLISDLVVLSYKMSQALHELQLSHRQSSYHAPSQATTGLETGRQHHTEWYCS